MVMMLVAQGGGVFLNVADGGKTLQLSIRSITPHDAGTYACKARNRLGHDEESSTLVVHCTYDRLIDGLVVKFELGGLVICKKNSSEKLLYMW